MYGFNGLASIGIGLSAIKNVLSGLMSLVSVYILLV